MLKQESVPSVSHLCPPLFIGKQAPQVTEEILLAFDLNGTPVFDQFLRDLQEVEHVGPEQDTFLEGQRFKRVVAAHGNEASSNENRGPEAVEPHQFPQGIEKNNRRRTLAVSSRSGLSRWKRRLPDPWDPFSLEYALNLLQPVEMAWSQDEMKAGNL
jgi:hypothetical protein